MARSTWRTASLRFWVLLGIFISIAPMLLSAVGLYITLDRTIIAGFQDVAARHRQQLVPIQQLQVNLWEVTSPLELSLQETDGAADVAHYRALRENIEAGFAAVLTALASNPQEAALVERARTNWTAADQAATHLFAIRRGADEIAAIEGEKEFDTAIAAAVDTLNALAHQITTDLDRDHADAVRSYDRAQWMSGTAAVVSFVMMLVGTFIIGRILLHSVDRLVEGAERFASGDREHRIDVQVPPELHKVAEEFNHMIVRIRDNEAVLSKQARKDGLTGLFNRRAFDEALAGWTSKRARADDAMALLLIDIDHFKRINDTHGHSTGDAVLRTAADAIASQFRDEDQVFRFGGEEFAVMLRNTDLPRAMAKAERVRAAFAEQAPSINRQPQVTVSIGVAIAAGDETAAVMVNRADEALYRAKSSGRNRVEMAA